MCEYDKLRDRVAYLEQLTDDGTKFTTAKLVEIQSLREENRLLREKVEKYELQFLTDSVMIDEIEYMVRSARMEALLEENKTLKKTLKEAYLDE